MKKILLALLLALSLNAFAVDVYDYDTGMPLESTINGNELEIYNDNTGEYTYEEIIGADGTGIHTFDYNTGKYKDYEWTNSYYGD